MFLGFSPKKTGRFITYVFVANGSINYPFGYKYVSFFFFFSKIRINKDALFRQDFCYDPAVHSSEPILLVVNLFCHLNHLTL